MSNIDLSDPNYMFQELEEYQKSWDFLPVNDSPEEWNSVNNIISPETKNPLDL